MKTQMKHKMNFRKKKKSNLTHLIKQTEIFLCRVHEENAGECDAIGAN